LNFGGMGGFLVIKLVNPTKIFCSWTPHHRGVNHRLLSKAEPHVRAAAARILGETNATVRGKVRRLDATDRAFHETAKLLALFIGNGGAQVLHLDHALADEYDLGDLRNARDPGVANQLRIQRQQSLRFFRVSTGGCFPLQQAPRAVEFPDGIDIGNDWSGSFFGSWQDCDGWANDPISSTEQMPMPYALRRARFTARVSATRISAPWTRKETLDGSASP